MNERFERPRLPSKSVRRVRAPVHYAWVIVASSFLVVLGVLGLARFAFGMVLPGLAADLGLDYREQGVLGASYFAGYLVVVAAMPWLSPRLGLKRLCVAGLAVVAMGLAVMVFSTDLRA
ncbi:MAG: YbfB/YjiJ family MFS transporter, partial [Gammaproteobacteria bacterium]